MEVFGGSLTCGRAFALFGGACDVRTPRGTGTTKDRPGLGSAAWRSVGPNLALALCGSTWPSSGVYRYTRCIGTSCVGGERRKPDSFAVGRLVFPAWTLQPRSNEWRQSRPGRGEPNTSPDQGFRTSERLDSSSGVGGSRADPQFCRPSPDLS